MRLKEFFSGLGGSILEIAFVFTPKRIDSLGIYNITRVSTAKNDRDIILLDSETGNNISFYGDVPKGSYQIGQSAEVVSVLLPTPNPTILASNRGAPVTTITEFFLRKKAQTEREEVTLASLAQEVHPFYPKVADKELK